MTDTVGRRLAALEARFVDLDATMTQLRAEMAEQTAHRELRARLTELAVIAAAQAMADRFRAGNEPAGAAGEALNALFARYGRPLVAAGWERGSRETALPLVGLLGGGQTGSRG
jgi:hypothetical protein